MTTPAPEVVMRILAVTATLAVMLQPVTAFAADEDEKFQVTDVIVDPNGTTHTRMERTFKGLRVLGGDVVRHQTESGTSSSLTLREKPKAEKAKISAKEAADKALFGGFKTDGKGELIYEARNSAGEPRLAWRWMVGGKQPDGTPVKAYVSVDARTGKVLLREEAVKTELGDGKSLYGGTVPLQTTKSGSTYELKDPTRGNTYTVDSANGTDFCIFTFCLWRAPANKITDADNHWADGTAANRATVAVDAQYGTNVTWDFYQTAFGRSGIKNDG
jgi:Zn-dependent metalloprotease